MTSNSAPQVFADQVDEIEAVITSHPRVHSAVVVAREDGLVSYVVPADTAPSAANAGAGDYVAQWRRVYDDMYSEEEFADDPQRGRLGSDFIGWNSSYTGAPIPMTEMLQWRAATVDRVRALQPSRVLEIGVGSGLLLSHLAPDCEEYRGMDFSPVTIAKLRARLRQADVPWAGRVHLRVAEAVETDRLPAEYFDTVIINSVVMCFPGHGYLRRVIEQALRVLAPGGSLYLGDIRNLSLLEEFAAAVQVAQYPSADPAGLHERVRRAVAGEDELMLAPEYFVATARELPEVAGVDIQRKRGTAVNELTRYRYDVVLHKAPVRAHSLAGVPRVVFADLDCRDIDDLGTHLGRIMGEQPGASLRVTEIPHGGLVGEVAAARRIRRGQPAVAAPGAQAAPGWLPEDLHLLAERLGLTAVVTLSAQPDRMDAVFLGPGVLGEAPHTGAGTREVLTDVYEAREPMGPAAGYANHPQASVLADDVRRFVAERVPASMVPSAVVIVGHLPLTADGELDRAALPAPNVTAAHG
jgi:SAM-dependent methyltransferase